METITLRPATRQWLMNQFWWLLLVVVLLVGAIVERCKQWPVAAIYITLAVALVIVVWSLWRLLLLKRTVCQITEEQLIYQTGLFTRSKHYMELYRVVDFNETSTLLQQLWRLKTVTVNSMDKSTPTLRVEGVPTSLKLSEAIRQRVEAIKAKKPILEVTNQ